MVAIYSDIADPVCIVRDIASSAVVVNVVFSTWVENDLHCGDSHRFSPVCDGQIHGLFEIVGRALVSEAVSEWLQGVGIAACHWPRIVVWALYWSGERKRWDAIPSTDERMSRLKMGGIREMVFRAGVSCWNEECDEQREKTEYIHIS
jgi:hypothetical protein